MKKRIYLALIAAMALSVTSCGRTADPSDSPIILEESTSEAAAASSAESSAEPVTEKESESETEVESSSETVSEESSSEEETPAASEAEGEYTIDYNGDGTADIADIMEMIVAGEMKKDNLSAEQIKEIESSLAAQGGTVTWDAQGNLQVAYEDGSTAAFNSGWPNADLIKGVPTLPDRVVSTTTVEQGNVYISVVISKEEAAAYGKKLAAAGFTADMFEYDLDDSYIFMGANSDGVSAIISYTESLCAIGFEKN